LQFHAVTVRRGPNHLARTERIKRQTIQQRRLVPAHPLITPPSVPSVSTTDSRAH
jgi:hypothetical protein